MDSKIQLKLDKSSTLKIKNHKYPKCFETEKKKIKLSSFLKQ